MSRKPSFCDRHSGQRVVDVGVEAGGDDQQPRLERLDGGLDDGAKGVGVHGVTGAGPQRDVHDGRIAGPRPARAGVERPLVERDEQDRVVAADDRLGAVSVMHVPVDDRDTLDAELRLRVTGRDDGVGEDAEAHGSIGERVVARRPYERETAHLDGAHGAPCRKPCRLPGGRAGRSCRRRASTRPRAPRCGRRSRRRARAR